MLPIAALGGAAVDDKGKTRCASWGCDHISPRSPHIHGSMNQ